MDYKETLNLPRTDFPMKANLSQMEPRIQRKWEEKDVYRCIREKSKGLPKYILHDGPPYANGNIHIGHALNKILKDIIIKYKSMRRFDCPFVPGWDCHGLPVEHQLFKELNISKHQISQLEFRKKAYDFAMKFVGIQKEEFKRLGVFGDWDNPYLTLSKDYEAEVIRALGKLVKEGYIYRGLKPVNWCYRCETALAEAEIEYQEHTSPSIYVKFEILGFQNKRDIKVPQDKKVYAVVWTTTPWTLIANVAIAVHPDFSYSLVEVGDEIWLVAEDLVSDIMEELGIKKFKIVDTILGKDLEYLPYRDIFDRRADLIFVLADYVSREEGTGCVHTAPGHGQEDYITGQRYHLETVMPVNSKGEFYLDIAGEFKGLHVFGANQPIVDRLKKNGFLLYAESITHSYPHCWRCKSPIIFRATEQWFMSVDHKDLRKKLLEAVTKDIDWIPSSGRERISSMISSRPDWCLSRQRYWGIPLPVVCCVNCNNKWIADYKIIMHFADIVSREGSDAWFKRELSELLPEGYRCPDCGEKNFVHGHDVDILDVWFESGVSHQAILKKREDLGVPAELYLEGSDQHRGWFQTSLIPALGIDGSAPFRTVLTHGFVVDGEGRKMSKSVGNVISPQEVIENLGADILRLWGASCDYNEDMRISDEILQRLSDAYRKIRNTCRFMLSNLYDFDPQADKLSHHQMLEIDRWALSKSASIIGEVTQNYERYLFHKIYQLVYHFCTITMSSFYLDILKDRLYTFPVQSLERRSAQTALYHILILLVKAIAPILAFTAEEIWQHIHKEGEPESIHLASWPDLDKLQRWLDPQLEARWERLIQIRQDVLKVLEERRVAGEIGNSLEAEVSLFVDRDELYLFLEKYRDQLPSVFIVSGVNLNRVETLPQGTHLSSLFSNLAISSKRTSGSKCERCWNWSLTVGDYDKYPTLCKRCVEVLEGQMKPELKD